MMTLGMDGVRTTPTIVSKLGHSLMYKIVIVNINFHDYGWFIYLFCMNKHVHTSATAPIL